MATGFLAAASEHERGLPRSFLLSSIHARNGCTHIGEPPCLFMVGGPRSPVFFFRLAAGSLLPRTPPFRTAGNNGTKGTTPGLEPSPSISPPHLADRRCSGGRSREGTRIIHVMSFQYHRAAIFRSGEISSLGKTRVRVVRNVFHLFRKTNIQSGEQVSLISSQRKQMLTH